ncbi:MAG: tetratricopeptide repeat protein [Bacteroidota bacterium]
MRYLIVISLFSFLFVGCSVFQKTTSEEGSKEDTVKDWSEVEVRLTNEEERQLDYYFYEGIRYKVIDEPQKSYMYFNEALKIDSTCAACSYEIARLLAGNEEYDRALEYMKPAFRYKPENKHYIQLLSSLYIKNGSKEEAVRVGENLLKLDDLTVEDLYFLAQLQLDNGFYDKAVSNLDKIENRIGVNEGLSLEKYQILLENEDYDSAEKELKKLIEKFPQTGDYYVYLGDFYFENDQKEKALETYEKCLEVDEDNGKVLFSMANYYMNTGDDEKFKDYLIKAFSSENVDFRSKFQRIMPFVANGEREDNPLDYEDINRIFDVLIEKHPKKSRAYGAFANYLVKKDKEQKALDLFDRALELDANQSEIWQEYLFLLSSLEKNELLLEKSEEAVTFFPDEPMFRLFHGVSLFQDDRLEEAADTMEKGLNNVEDNPGLKGRLHSYLGDIYHSMDDMEKCFHHYDKALEIDENNLIVLNNYSYYLAVRGEELEKAERMSSKTIEMEPGNPTYLDTYAWVLFKRGEYSEAQFIMERAIDKMEEPSGEILEHYGDILFKNDKVDEALEKWEDALKYDDHSDLLEEKIEKRKYIDEQQ